MLFANIEPRVRFAQTQKPSSVLRLFGRAPEKLNQERGECFDGAPVALPGEERAKQGNIVHAAVERLGEQSVHPSASPMAAYIVSSIPHFPTANNCGIRSRYNWIK